MRHIEPISRSATLLTGVGFLLLGGLITYGSLDGSKGVIGPVVLVGTLVALGAGLISRSFWARRAAAALCLVVAVFLPIGFINPFAAMDLPEPQPLAQILAWMIPTLIGLVLLAWLVDPPRGAQPNKSLERTREG